MANTNSQAPARAEPKVALVAVASKEGAYIADWVFHHLQFGFDPILVLVNRSSDRTEEMVAQISQGDSRVQVINVDFLDKGVVHSNKHIQSDAYKFGFENLRDRLLPNGYLVCLDIDEFWTPLDFTTTIYNYLHANGLPQKFSFNWFLSIDEPRVFGPAFKPANRGQHDVNVKSGFHVGLPVTNIRAHQVDEPDQLPLFLASCGYVKGSLSQTPEAPATLGDAFVLHRLNRSMVEYVALLGRTNLEAGKLAFKRNRKGFLWTGRFAGAVQDFRVTAEQLDVYYSDFNRFLCKHDLDEMIFESRVSMLDRNREVMARFSEMTPEEREAWGQHFSDVDMDRMDNMRAAISTELKTLKGSIRLDGFLHSANALEENSNM